MATDNTRRQQHFQQLAKRTSVTPRFQGQAYIFLRRWGANGNGHAAWGYRSSASGYDCGAVENNITNSAVIKPGDPNDAWFLFHVPPARMLGLMRGGVGVPEMDMIHYHDARYPDAYYRFRPAPAQASPLQVTGRLSVGEDGTFGPPEHTDPVHFRRYTEFAWIDVEHPDVAAARKVARWSPNIGYALIGNNCANTTWDVVRAYGVPADRLALLQIDPQPTIWFEDCLRRGWTRCPWPLEASTAPKGGTEVTTEYPVPWES